MATFKPAVPAKDPPQTRFVDLKGEELDLGRYKGKVVVLNFWATWCAPCVREMPSLDRLQAALGGEGLAVLPLSLDGPTKPRVEPFYKAQNLANLPILFDEKNVTFGRFGVGLRLHAVRGNGEVLLRRLHGLVLVEIDHYPRKQHDEQV